MDEVRGEQYYNRGTTSISVILLRILLTIFNHNIVQTCQNTIYVFEVNDNRTVSDVIIQVFTSIFHMHDYYESARRSIPTHINLFSVFFNGYR